jgi:hypothetical protein
VLIPTRGAGVPGNIDEYAHAPASGATATDDDESVGAMEAGLRPVANPIAPLLHRPELAMERALDHANACGAQAAAAKRDPHRRASGQVVDGANGEVGPLEWEQAIGRRAARAERRSG